MKKAYCILFSALLMVACGDDNSSSANDNELSSPSEESFVESSSVNEAASSSNTENVQSSFSSNNQTILDFGDNKIVIKEIPTFGELDGKPYFYTTQPRCTYRNGTFSTNPALSEYAYFYDISNETLTTSLIKLHEVFAGNYEDYKLRETYYGQNKSIEGKWNFLCYINLIDGYTQCSRNHQMIVTKDTIYSVFLLEQSKDEAIFHIAELTTHTSLGYFEEITTKITNSNETIYTKIALSTEKKECVLISESTPVKSSKYCSEEFLPYLQIDDFDGYVST